MFALISSFASANFTNFVITNNSQQKQSTHTQYSSSEISWKANSHDAIPAVHHRACCSKSDRSDAFTAHLRVSYKAPQIIPGGSPSAPPLLLHIPQNLCVQVDLFKSNPAASTDPVIIHLLSPRVTDLGLKLPKNIILTLSHIAMILWGTLWLSAVHFYKTNSISMGNEYHHVGWGRWKNLNIWNNLCCWIKWAIFLELQNM